MKIAIVHGIISAQRRPILSDNPPQKVDETVKKERLATDQSGSPRVRRQ